QPQRHVRMLLVSTKRVQTTGFACLRGPGRHRTVFRTAPAGALCRCATRFRGGGRSGLRCAGRAPGCWAPGVFVFVGTPSGGKRTLWTEVEDGIDLRTIRLPNPRTPPFGTLLEAVRRPLHAITHFHCSTSRHGAIRFPETQACP